MESVLKYIQFVYRSCLECAQIGMQRGSFGGPGVLALG